MARTDFKPAEINRFRDHTGKIFIAFYYRQLSADIKIKIIRSKVKTSFVSPKGAKGPG